MIGYIWLWIVYRSIQQGICCLDDRDNYCVKYRAYYYCCSSLPMMWLLCLNQEPSFFEGQHRKKYFVHQHSYSFCGYSTYQPHLSSFASHHKHTHVSECGVRSMSVFSSCSISDVGGSLRPRLTGDAIPVMLGSVVEIYFRLHCCVHTLFSDIKLHI